MASENRAVALRKELTRFTNIVVKTLAPRQVIVYGSFASGEIREWSDLDLVVVMDTELPFLDRVDLVQRLVRPQVAVDILVYTPSEWADLVETRSFIREEIVDKGKVVYDRRSTALAR